MQDVTGECQEGIITMGKEGGENGGAQGQARFSTLRKHWWLVLVAGCLIIAAAYVFLIKPAIEKSNAGKKRNNAQTRVMPVVAISAKIGDLSIYVNGLGTVTPVYTVTVRTRVDGQLMDVYYGGPDRQQRGPACPHRSQALRGAAGPGRGTAGPRPGVF